MTDIGAQFSAEDKKVFEYIRQAAREGGLVLIKCTRQADGERVACLGALERHEGGHMLNICATLVHGVAKEQFGVPFNVFGDSAEMAKLGVEAPGKKKS